MNNRCKRITVGFVLPIIIAVLICGIFYYKNAHQSLLDYMGTEEVNDGSKVILTKQNWEEYFTLETKQELYKNDAGELEKVQYVHYISLKEEYHDKLDESAIGILNLTVMQPMDRMEYTITDAKEGKWELGKVINLGIPIPGEDRTSYSWRQVEQAESGYVRVIELDSGEHKGKLYMAVPEKFEIEAISGELIFK